MPKLRDIISAGGILPAVASGAFGKENRGFALGLAPGFAYKDQYRDEEEEKERMAREAATGVPRQRMKKGGKVASASKRADGCAQRGKTKGRMV
jgi:hypothetical protein